MVGKHNGFDIYVRIYSRSSLFPQTPVGRNLRDWSPIWSNGSVCRRGVRILELLPN